MINQKKIKQKEEINRKIDKVIIMKNMSYKEDKPKEYQKE